MIAVPIITINVNIVKNYYIKMDKKMAKKYLRSDQECPECKSSRGPCNMHNPKIVEPRSISIEGHCQECGYSFTRIFELKFVEEMERN